MLRKCFWYVVTLINITLLLSTAEVKEGDTKEGREEIGKKMNKMLSVVVRTEQKALVRTFALTVPLPGEQFPITV